MNFNFYYSKSKIIKKIYKFEKKSFKNKKKRKKQQTENNVKSENNDFL